MLKSVSCRLAVLSAAFVFGLGTPVLAEPVADPTAALLAERDSSTDVVPGVWNSNLWACKAYAEEHGLPMVAVWSNGSNCPHCEEFEWAVLSAPFESWRQTSDVVLCFTYYGDAGEGSDVYNWCWGDGSLGLFPFVRFYWVKDGTTLVDEVHTGDDVDGSNGLTLADQDDPDYDTYNVDGRAAKSFIETVFKGNTVVVAASCTITFRGNGGTAAWSTSSRDQGAAYGTLPTAKRTGYTFAGWYTASSGGAKITSTSIVPATAAKTLYAHWYTNKYTVTYKGNGGYPATQTYRQPYNAQMVMPTTPRRTGFTFGGWTNSAGRVVNASTIYTKSSGSTNGARWYRNKYTVTYLGNGGSPAIQTYRQPYGQTMVMPSTPARSGYTFLGWTNSVGQVVGSSTTYTKSSGSTCGAAWACDACVPSR